MFLPITNYTILFRFWQPCTPICSADVQFSHPPRRRARAVFSRLSGSLPGQMLHPAAKPISSFQMHAPFSGAAVPHHRKPTLFFIIAGSFIRQSLRFSRPRRPQGSCRLSPAIRPVFRGIFRPAAKPHLFHRHSPLSRAAVPPRPQSRLFSSL